MFKFKFWNLKKIKESQLKVKAILLKDLENKEYKMQVSKEGNLAVNFKSIIIVQSNKICWWIYLCEPQENCSHTAEKRCYDGNNFIWITMGQVSRTLSIIGVFDKFQNIKLHTCVIPETQIIRYFKVIWLDESANENNKTNYNLWNLKLIWFSPYCIKIIVVVRSCCIKYWFFRQINCKRIQQRKSSPENSPM